MAVTYFFFVLVIVALLLIVVGLAGVAGNRTGRSSLRYERRAGVMLIIAVLTVVIAAVILFFGLQSLHLVLWTAKPAARLAANTL